MTQAHDLIKRLASGGQSVAVAESLTGGLLAAALVDTPGASAVFAGGVVAYQAEQKSRQLGIDPEFLAERGTVDPEIAMLMAKAVRERFATDFGLSTTGVAGPKESEGKAVGTVYIGISSSAGETVLAHHFTGNRNENRSRTVAEALSGLAAILEEQS